MPGKTTDGAARVSPDDRPMRSELSRDDLRGAESLPDAVDGERPQAEGEVPGNLPEEDDDNPYQESDEALPDDLEEDAIERNLSQADGRSDAT